MFNSGNAPFAALCTERSRWPCTSTARSPAGHGRGSAPATTRGRRPPRCAAPTLSSPTPWPSAHYVRSAAGRDADHPPYGADIISEAPSGWRVSAWKPTDTHQRSPGSSRRTTCSRSSAATAPPVPSCRWWWSVRRVTPTPTPMRWLPPPNGILASAWSGRVGPAVARPSYVGLAASCTATPSAARILPSSGHGRCADHVYDCVFNREVAGDDALWVHRRGGGGGGGDG